MATEKADKIKFQGSDSHELDHLGTKDIEAADIIELDHTELFLRENGITHTRVQELLQDTEGVKRLMRRVDLLLLPLLCGTSLLQFIDKQALSYSAVFDLFSTTGITSDEYSWLGSLFYFGSCRNIGVETSRY